MEPIWVFVLFFIFVIVVVGITTYFEHKRTAAIQTFASTIGFTFTGRDRDAIAPYVQNFELFQKGRNRRVKNLIYGPFSNATIYLFDYSYVTGRGKRSNISVQTVVLFHSPSLKLPPFSLVPENILHRVVEQFSYGDIDFDDYPKFSKQYLLRGENEALIRQTFNRAVLSFYESKPGLCTEGSGSQLVYYQIRQRVKPDKLRSMLDSAQQAYRLFAR